MSSIELIVYCLKKPFFKKVWYCISPRPPSGDSNPFIRLVVALRLLTFPFSPSATSCFTLCLMGPASIYDFPHCPLTPLAPPFLTCLVRLGLQLRLRPGTNWGSKECILLIFSLSQWPKVLCTWQAFLHQCRHSINSHLLFLDFQINPSNSHLPIRLWLPPPSPPQSLGEGPGKNPQCRESWASAALPSVPASPLGSCSVQSVIAFAMTSLQVPIGVLEQYCDTVQLHSHVGSQGPSTRAHTKHLTHSNFQTMLCFCTNKNTGCPMKFESDKQQTTFWLYVCPKYYMDIFILKMIYYVSAIQISLGILNFIWCLSPSRHLQTPSRRVSL